MGTGKDLFVETKPMLKEEKKEGKSALIVSMAPKDRYVDSLEVYLVLL